jgi:hypothetical protein
MIKFEQSVVERMVHNLGEWRVEIGTMSKQGDLFYL